MCTNNLLKFDEEETEQQLGGSASGRKRLFSKELRCMMYGFGDDQNPYTESVDFLEDLVIEFITETTHRYKHNTQSLININILLGLYIHTTHALSPKG
jgi:hypothetical protein